jgi:hypothetical protein
MSLLDEILALPAELRAQQDTQAIADALSVGRVALRTVLVGNGQILSTLGLAAGNVLLDALGSLPDYRHVRPMLEQGTLDIANPLVRAGLDGLVAANVLAADGAAALKALAEYPETISEQAVRAVCWSDNGIWSV